MARYSLEALTEFGTQALVHKGVPVERAGEVARVQVEIEACGLTSHGLPVLFYLIRNLGASIHSERLPLTRRNTGAAAVLDCRGCMGVECLLIGRDLCEAKAAEHGLGFVALHSTGWAGALGYHLAPLTRKGYVAMAWAQMSGQALVAPFGGREARLSTSPMALAFPAGPNPVIADFSTAATSRGRLSQMKSSGKKPPEALLLDSLGRPTDDPAVLDNGGSILPFGGVHYGFRGTALAMWIEALTAASGARPVNAEHKGGQHVHILALSIDALGGAELYGTAMEELLAYVLSSAPAEGSGGPRMPWQHEWQALAQARTDGLALSDYALKEMNKISEECSMSMPEPYCM